MPLFLLVFFSIYGFFHLYFFWKARSIIQPNQTTTWLLIIFLLLMTAAPVTVRMVERFGYDTSARITAAIGYAWMGFVFLFFFTGLFFDIFRLSLWLAERFIPRFNGCLFCRVFIFTVPAILSSMMTIYGFYEAAHIRTTTVAFTSSRITTGTRIRLVQISDVHLGLMNGRKKLQQIVNLINKEKPDILVATGDLVDGQKNNLNGLAELIASIDAPLGKFAVTGNHEYYAGIEQSLIFLSQSGFTVLDGKAISIGSDLAIAGIADNRVGHFENGSESIERQLRKTIASGRFTVLLKHRPFVSAGTPYDLQLSGHTHKGQIFPFNFITELVYPHPEGRLIALPAGGCLYTSRGAGTWGPPIRFLAPPEITVLDLTGAENN